MKKILMLDETIVIFMRIYFVFEENKEIKKLLKDCNNQCFPRVVIIVYM